jgi:hypothetical protein
MSTIAKFGCKMLESVENVAFQSLYTFVLHAEIATTFGPKMGAL